MPSSIASDDSLNDVRMASFLAKPQFIQIVAGQLHRGYRCDSGAWYASSLKLVRLAHSLAHYLAFSGIGAVDISKLKSNGYYTIAVRACYS